MKTISMKKYKKIFLVVAVVLLALGLLGVIAVVGINCYMVNSTKKQILSEEEAAALQNVDCVVVLGCQVKPDGTPSHMLEDRLKRGVALYKAGAAPKLLMSGDHGTKGYDEVDTMKRYAFDEGIVSEDIFMDHAGFSTYETVYRAKEIFGAKKVVFVTQTYHLYRTLYIANALGLEAYGVPAEYRTYSGQAMQDMREFLARVKAFGMTIFKPLPTYMGEAIPISGNGELTHDDKSNFS